MIHNSTSRLVKILDILKKDYKKDTLSSRQKSPYTVLISCLLSLRTKDENTEKVANSLFKIADTPKKILKIPEKKLEKILYSTGFYKKKTKTIKNVSRIIAEKYNNKVPSDLDSLLKIKGIGRKTANIVLVYGYNKNALPIDTHCHRIPNRLGLIQTRTPEHTERELTKILPKKYWNKFNFLFVQHGQKVCVPVSPKCSICQIKKYCERQNINSSR